MPFAATPDVGASTKIVPAELISTPPKPNCTACKPCGVPPVAMSDTLITPVSASVNIILAVLEALPILPHTPVAILELMVPETVTSIFPKPLLHARIPREFAPLVVIVAFCACVILTTPILVVEYICAKMPSAAAPAVVISPAFTMVMPAAPVVTARCLISTPITIELMLVSAMVFSAILPPVVAAVFCK